MRRLPIFCAIFILDGYKSYFKMLLFPFFVWHPKWEALLQLQEIYIELRLEDSIFPPSSLKFAGSVFGIKKKNKMQTVFS